MSWLVVNAIGFIPMVPFPTLDFTKPALKQPPGGRGRIVLTAYVPQLRHRAGSAIPAVGLERTELSPWGIGVIGFAIVGLCAIAYTMFLPEVEEHQAGRDGVGAAASYQDAGARRHLPDQHQGAVYRWRDGRDSVDQPGDALGAAGDRIDRGNAQAFPASPATGRL